MRREGSTPRPRAWRVALVAVAAALPWTASSLEPRYDHRDQQGPTIEALYLKDVVWRSSSESTSGARSVLRASWGFDPTGDGNELLFGAGWAFSDDGSGTGDEVKLTLDARYRATVGTDQLKTLLEVGIWGSAAESVSIGPQLGLGLIFDFSRNFGLFASGSLAASIGQVRVVSFGGGVGLQLRYE